MQRNIMTAIGRKRFTPSSTITVASLDRSRATAFQQRRTISVTQLRKMGTSLPYLSTTPAPTSSNNHLGLKSTGNLCHHQNRKNIKYSGQIYKSFTDNNGDDVTHKENLDPKVARRIFLTGLAVLGLLVCLWFVLCYEIGNLIGMVFRWLGWGISLKLRWIWWFGCEVIKFLVGGDGKGPG